ncbi:MAG: hypothetical protein LBE13_02060 [Bacteroidales bacterium]|jgi:hypothetical protein|nr:hypothetical protein [Bacteroidales bacterium]
MSGLFSWLYNCLLNIYHGAYNAIYAACKWCYDFVLSIGLFLWNLLFWIFDLLVDLLYLSVDFFLVLSVGIFDLFFILIPDFQFPNNFEVIIVFCVDIVSVLNVFFPVVELFYCVNFYLSVLFFWCVYKLIKSWIPTVSSS